MDDARFAEIVAERPVKAMTCDSTNVFSTHEGRSESTLGPALTELIKGASGMVVATRQLLDYDVEGEGVRDVVGHLLHLFLALGRVFLSHSELAVAVAAPREKLCVRGPLAVLVSR